MILSWYSWSFYLMPENIHFLHIQCLISLVYYCCRNQFLVLWIFIPFRCAYLDRFKTSTFYPSEDYYNDTDTINIVSVSKSVSTSITGAYYLPSFIDEITFICVIKWQGSYFYTAPEVIFYLLYFYKMSSLDSCKLIYILG